MTQEEAEDNTTCPSCGSKNVELLPSGCLCKNRDGHSCWHHPKCSDCGFTVGSSSGNSEGGMWLSFVGKENFEIPDRRKLIPVD